MKYIQTKFIIYVVLCLMFCSINIYASNIGRTVYGIYTETYNGVGNNTTTGSDNLIVYAGGSLLETTEEKFDGIFSYKVGNGGWVSFVFGNGNQDMSDYTGGRICFCVKVSSDMSASLNLMYIKIQDSSGVKQLPFNSSSIKRIGTTSTGVVADNAWHTYYIELSSFTDLGLNLNSITNPFLVSSDANGNFFIDYVYLVKASSATRSFNVTVKNVSNNQETDDITWSQDCFRQSWKSANQYIELDLDQESTNWYVRIYLNNGNSSRNGLYCVDSDGSEIVLPMAWRIRPDTLPNASGDTLLIARYDKGSKGLYDVGKNPSGTDWYTWCPMREVNAGLEFDDVKIWNLRGLHTVVWENDSYDTLKNYYERKPKIYFGADCSNALGGLTYTANIVTELIYE